METVFSLFFSGMVISNDNKYGPIGFIFALLSYLTAIGVVVILGAVAGLAWCDTHLARARPSIYRCPQETAAGQVTNGTVRRPGPESGSGGSGRVIIRLCSNPIGRLMPQRVPMECHCRARTGYQQTHGIWRPGAGLVETMWRPCGDRGLFLLASSASVQQRDSVCVMSVIMNRR